MSVLLIGRWQTVRWLLIFTLVALAGEYMRVRSRHFESFIARYFAFMMRPDELRQKRVQFNGATWAFISGLATFAIFPVYASVPAFTVLALADPAASMVGRMRGKTQLMSGKTLEGSIAFFVVAFMLLFALTNLTMMGTLFAVLVATLAELLEVGVNDNLRVPLATGCVLVLL